MAKRKRNPAIGSDFDEFLAENALLENSYAVAIKRVIAWQLETAMKIEGVTKKTLAERMHTSRSHLDRLLDERDTGLTIETLGKAARALGRNVRIQLCAT
ncbi:MAG TPA: Fis family transcriptional regulator [Rudaea sp.]|jgi:ParB-like chromosome segregation protein Spo0J|nr:Fis family transcriptional regulator [Rudaea sp.]